MSTLKTRAAAIFAAALAFSATSAASSADETQDAIRKLQNQVGDLQQQMKQKDREIESLKKSKGADGKTSALDAAIESIDGDAAQKPTVLDRAAKSPIDISLDVLFAVGTSSERDEVIQQLQGGGHDPNRRGFTLQQAELSIMGDIDPYVRGESHLIMTIDPEGETVIELEEAFLQTTALPDGFQVEGGLFLTEFGLVNPAHPHSWDWLDQPVINSRLFGPDGLRQVGARLSQLLPVEHFSEWHVGIQQAAGETTQSFFANDEVYDPAEGDRSIGGLEFMEQETRSAGDFLYHVRWVNGWDINEKASAQFGASALLGPNASGTRGDTVIYGVDLKVKGNGPGPRGTGWIWQTEWMKRDFDVDAANANFVDGDLEDWGFYTQLQCWLNRRWAAGLRYEMAGGSGANSDPAAPGTPISRDTDPFRADRYRISPLITFMPSEFSRYRLQYNYDNSAHMADTAHTVWFGVEFVLGAHPAHGY